MDWWLILAAFLYFACAVLIVTEIFVPSGGLISICALACLIGGLMIFFQSEVEGWVGIVVALIVIPLTLAVSYKVFPKTRFGKTVTLSPPDRLRGDAVPDSEELKDMLGAEGLVVTPLRPVGMCDFSGRKLECVAESGYVDKDEKVKVIDVESTQLTVRVTEKS